MSSPGAFYRSGAGGVAEVDRAFYDRLAADTDGRELVERFVIPIRSGRAWEVPAGCLCRIVTTPEGPQCGDLNVWNRHNPGNACGLPARASSRAPM